MRAMILAAGQGKRMRPLTDTHPKPLLPVAGKPLLQHHVEALARAGFTELVINHARFGDRIEEFLADGAALGVKIHYSAEGNSPLGTGGGIKQALPLLGEEPFLVINGDIWTDFPLNTLSRTFPGQAHLVLVPNPAHHPQGDFALQDGDVSDSGQPRYTFSGIGVYRSSLFNSIKQRVFPLGPVLRQAMQNRQVTGELHRGHWFDIGTPARLAALESYLAKINGVRLD